MEKYCFTHGIIDGKPQEIKPAGTYAEHLDALKELTDNEGRIKKGKTEKQVTQAVIYHSTKGQMKRRKFKV
jgi:hypothetical protein